MFRKPGFEGLPAGQRVGSPASGGRRQATFNGTRYYVDKLIWLLETGALPTGPLLHGNGDNLDDRFPNLKEGRRRPAASVLTQRFLARANSRFQDAHDLSEVEYVDHDTPVRISCRIHGPFQRKPSSYLGSTHGCPRCCIEQYRRAVTKSTEAKRERKRATDRLYRRANKALYTAAVTRYYLRNRSKPEFVVALMCRNMLARVLHNTKRSKAARTEAALGYTFVEFKAHIEKQFEPWMTWENHGEWHVDHIYPVSRFIRDGVTDVRVINALSNLRPLAKLANLMKKDKLLAQALPR